VSSLNDSISGRHRKQRTLQNAAVFSGIGCHTGKEVTMRFCPAEENFGIAFKRTDLPHQPLIPATVKSVVDTSRSTTIGIGDVRIHTIEHVMAAVRAFDIDNLCIEVSNIEPPIYDGSSSMFVEMIIKAGVLEQSANVAIAKINTPLYWSEGDIHLVALPYDGYRITYTLHYPESKALGAQFHSTLVNSETFVKEIAQCRTFSRYEEVAMLMDRGLIKGGSLDNAIIIKGEVVFSKGGLHFSNEMARHKLLDLIGDLSLVGKPFHAHVIAVRSGHASNHQLAKKLHEHFMTEAE